jgi:hypothetical protein
VADVKGKVTKPPTAATVVPAASGTWYVINGAPPTGPGGIGSGILDYTVAQKPFPAGATEVSGPYRTRAEAEAGLARDKARAQSFKGPDIPNPLSGIGAVGHWIGLAVKHLTDGAMWRSIGWLLLGMILVIAGVYLWFRTSNAYKSLESSVTGIAKTL